jgi:hypothetical protein
MAGLVAASLIARMQPDVSICVVDQRPDPRLQPPRLLQQQQQQQQHPSHTSDTNGSGFPSRSVGLVLSPRGASVLRRTSLTDDDIGTFGCNTHHITCTETRGLVAPIVQTRWKWCLSIDLAMPRSPIAQTGVPVRGRSVRAADGRRTTFSWGAETSSSCAATLLATDRQVCLSNNHYCTQASQLCRKQPFDAPCVD